VTALQRARLAYLAARLAYLAEVKRAERRVYRKDSPMLLRPQAG
jgi:hypothetical protein